MSGNAEEGIARVGSLPVFRIVQQSLGDFDSPFESAGERFDAVSGPVAQAEPVE